jgi:hypothetical protein
MVSADGRKGCGTSSCKRAQRASSASDTPWRGITGISNDLTAVTEAYRDARRALLRARVMVELAAGHRVRLV